MPTVNVTTMAATARTTAATAATTVNPHSMMSVESMQFLSTSTMTLQSRPSNLPDEQATAAEDSTNEAEIEAANLVMTDRSPATRPATRCPHRLLDNQRPMKTRLRLRTTAPRQCLRQTETSAALASRTTTFATAPTPIQMTVGPRYAPSVIPPSTLGASVDVTRGMLSNNSKSAMRTVASSRPLSTTRASNRSSSARRPSRAR